MAEPRFNVPSALSEQAKQFLSTLNRFKECAMRKRPCTQAEKATIRTSLSVAAFLLIVGLLGLSLKYREKRLRDEIYVLAGGDDYQIKKNVSFEINEGQSLGTFMKNLENESDIKKRIERLRKLKKALELSVG